jgi:hypothetical protein
MVRPPRVGESPVSMECKVIQVIHTGDQGGAGNLVICEVVLMHINEEILGSDGRIDPWKLDAVARLGSDYYSRVQGNSIFTVPKPLDKIAVGIDQLPTGIKSSKILTGNDLGLLANVQRVPDSISIDQLKNPAEYLAASSQGTEAIHRLAQKFLDTGDVDEAWNILLANK